MARNLPYYWVRENAIPHELCDMIVAERQTLIEKAAGVGLNNQAPPDNLRKTSVAWADRNHWLEGILLNNAHYANREAGWNIDVSSHYNEQVQLAKYETGHFYDWHKDTRRGVAVNMLLTPHARSFCVFTDKKEGVVFNTQELKYKPTTYYLFNTQQFHTVYNFETTRYLLSIEFKKDLNELSFEDLLKDIKENYENDR